MTWVSSGELENFTIDILKIKTFLSREGRILLLFLFGLMLNVPVNNISVMLGRSHRFLGITSTFGGGGGGGGGGKYVLLKDTTQRPEWGSSPRPLDRGGGGGG